MPTVSPITGAEDPPSAEVTYSAEGSLDILSLEISPAEESIEVQGLQTIRADQSIDIFKSISTPAESSIDTGTAFIDESIGSLDIVVGENFMILADILQEELAGTNVGA